MFCLITKCWHNRYPPLDPDQQKGTQLVPEAWTLLTGQTQSQPQEEEEVEPQRSDRVVRT